MYVCAQLLLQLRNAGIGRLVTMGAWRRAFPDQPPSFAKVLRVEPKMDRVWLLLCV